MTGKLDQVTQDAIDLYQEKVVKAKKLDGRVDINGGMIR
jgi:hypothetical protein